MAESDIFDILNCISKAILEIKPLRDTRPELGRAIEEVKKHADVVEKFSLPKGEQLDDLKLSSKERSYWKARILKLTDALTPLLSSLRLELCTARDTSCELERWLRSSDTAIREFDGFVNKIKAGSSSVPRQVVENLCAFLRQFEQMGEAFSSTFEAFNSQLSRAQQLTEQLQAEMDRQSIEISRKAGRDMWLRVAEALGWTVGSAGVVMLGFYYGAQTLDMAASMFKKAIKNFKQANGIRRTKRALPRRIMQNCDKGLAAALARDLTVSCDRAASIQWSTQFTEILKCLDVIITTRASEERIAQLQKRLRDLGIEDD
ncbi:hypothetical protein BOX15_Mlig005639g1 [Macrostomum lignano]|uniref:Uncharacterized protein n=1 Tax=Macrostomum lignano TaxID=282301 RepID=A0A267FDG3_9PLAT|nr:hypothetical protein BOX15_Mlig005639g1 [Macrostomum lignano]